MVISWVTLEAAHFWCSHFPQDKQKPEVFLHYSPALETSTRSTGAVRSPFSHALSKLREALCESKLGELGEWAWGEAVRWLFRNSHLSSRHPMNYCHRSRISAPSNHLWTRGYCVTRAHRCRKYTDIESLSWKGRRSPPGHVKRATSHQHLRFSTEIGDPYLCQNSVRPAPAY